MKREGNLYKEVVDWKNLLLAAKKARRGKRYRFDVSEFHWDMERELICIQQALRDKTYNPGCYRSFEITDPKRRMISAAPYRDRVVHHAICNIIEPILDRSFVFDSYACRQGKGQLAALKRARFYMTNYKYVARTDIRKYFASIDHDVLMENLKRKFKDPDLLWVIERIVRTQFPRQERPSFFPGDDLLSHAERNCGLPLGNQTSQLFGNFYLDRLDHRLKEEIGIPGMIRYMDDIVLFADSKQQLWDALAWMEGELKKIRLRMHERKTSVTTTKDGIRFLGHHVQTSTLRLFPESVIRLRRRFRHLYKELEAGAADSETVRQVIASYWGFVQISGYRKTFRQIINDYSLWEVLRSTGRSADECSAVHTTSH
jgi:retron-type reverse transcriptase